MTLAAEPIAPGIATSDIAALDRAFEGLRQAHAAAPYPSREARLDQPDRLERTLRMMTEVLYRRARWRPVR